MRSSALATAVALAALVHAFPAGAVPQRLRLEPDATAIAFTLGATLHEVQGELRLVGGELRFDTDTGEASGELVVDATSARTGLGARDRTMHGDVLESGRHPRIVFRAERLSVLRRDTRGADVELAGRLEMHGQQRPLVLPARLELAGDRVAIEAGFRVPYVDWGMQDPSTFLLRVDRFVDVTVSAGGRVLPLEPE